MTRAFDLDRRSLLGGMAGLGAGVWKDQDAVRAAWREERRFRPAGDKAAIAAHIARWDAAVAKA